ncbi:imidazole glycerol phosphate synthase [Paenibacillus swuensis]|uniref:Imidazole glycerol phosphate synthase subunit HisH n=1 Tax=Paenibacillus swuensis TaxID=1178515 RepID=A0A172TIF5_9BACL|nr:imidazole glycerol phosphate synthase subunit HisH [Paenibacillus swuensis]ANE46835.1 imidazole glycerol phosphate synthase [Paenibacillus swuensis]
MIAIIDYGMGNLHSVSKAVERLGFAYKVTAEESELLAADGVILPGVGAFGDAMVNLRETGLDESVRKVAEAGIPLLGICLGMQLLFERSEEYGDHEGLSLLPGRVVRFQGDYKVPHMGWNRLEARSEHPLLRGLDQGHVYFVHSYHVVADKAADVLAVTDYYQKVTAVVGREQVYGMQFHPEKSGEVGMKLLENFLRLTVRQVQ